jgi:membrane protease YdiL (CAAX protease family)
VGCCYPIDVPGFERGRHAAERRDWSAAAGLRDGRASAGQPLSIISYLLFLFVFGPLPEELGWSGYALDGLQSKRSALMASLIIGFVWAVWHLPLFFMEGTFQSEQIGFATPAFWWYMLPTLPISVLDTWIYNNANRSTLSAVLLHFMVNVSGELIGLSQHARFCQAGLIFIVTAAIVVIWGPKTLMRQPTDQATQRADRLTVAA